MTARAAVDQLAARSPQLLLSPRRRDTPLSGAWRVRDLLALDGEGPTADRLAVAVVEGPTGAVFVAPVVEDRSGARRAQPGDGVAEALVAQLVAGPGRRGDFELEVLHSAAARGEREIPVDQTNESVAVGDQAVVKWLTWADDHPAAPARLVRLARAGFTSMPRVWGFLWWHDGSRRLLLASVSELLREASDGWQWCVDDVRRFAAGECDLDEALGPVARAGAVVAQLHMALSQGGSQRAGLGAAASWSAQALSRLDEALRLVDGDEGRRLHARAPAVRKVLAAIADVTDAQVVDVHGDLHVGQLLRHRRSEGGWDYAVTDFDGNPVLDQHERNAPQPAARDVAGFVQSLDHVGRVVLRRTSDVDVDAVRRWMVHARPAFLDAYQQALPAGSTLYEPRLLRPFQVEQECREFVYAATHLPRWRYVPDAALAELVPLPGEPVTSTTGPERAED